MEKELQLRPLFFFIMQNATAIMNVFFCAKKMLLRCNVFHERPQATVAANESIVDPPVFLNMSLLFFFSLYKGRECFDLKI